MHEIVIFMHMPKAASTALGRIIQRQYGADRVITLYDSILGEEAAELPRADIGRVAAIMGHFYFGVDEYVDVPSTYVTMLRNPVDRVISHYFFVRNDPSHYQYELANSLDLAAFVESCGWHEPNNDQTRLLSGDRKAAELGLCSDNLLDVAERNLAERFLVVGIAEDFDRSLILLKHALGWRWPLNGRENVGRRPRAEAIRPETVRVIEEFNALDIELYDFARDWMRKQIEREGAAFARDVMLFRLQEAEHRSLDRFRIGSRELARRLLALGSTGDSR